VINIDWSLTIFILFYFNFNFISSFLFYILYLYLYFIYIYILFYFHLFSFYYFISFHFILHQKRLNHGNQEKLVMRSIMTLNANRASDSFHDIIKYSKNIQDILMTQI